MSCFLLKTHWIKALLHSVVRHKFRWLAGAACVFFSTPVYHQWLCWHMIRNGGYDYDAEFKLLEVFFWSGFLAPAIFFIILRRWLLSEKWMLLCLGCMLYMLLPEFGLKSPYCDPGRVESFMDYWSYKGFVCMIFSVITAPELFFIHFALRNKKRRLPLLRRIISPLAAGLLFAVLAFFVCWALSHIDC